MYNYFGFCTTPSCWLLSNNEDDDDDDDERNRFKETKRNEKKSNKVKCNAAEEPKKLQVK